MATTLTITLAIPVGTPQSRIEAAACAATNALIGADIEFAYGLLNTGTIDGEYNGQSYGTWTAV